MSVHAHVLRFSVSDQLDSYLYVIYVTMRSYSAIPQYHWQLDTRMLLMILWNHWNVSINLK